MLCIVYHLVTDLSNRKAGQCIADKAHAYYTKYLVIVLANKIHNLDKALRFKINLFFVKLYVQYNRTSVCLTYFRSLESAFSSSVLECQI